MPEMRCHPGQDGSVAFAGGPVCLTPVSDKFPATPATLRLYSSYGGSGAMGLLLPVGCWSENMIVAKVPAANPRGTGKLENETFSIRFTSGDSTWTADDIRVTGPETSNYPDPPTHTPEAEKSLANHR